MDYLITLPKTLLDLAVSFLKIKKDDRSRQRLADLLSAISVCVSGIGDAVEAGKHPTKLCAELSTYASKVKSLVEEHVDQQTAEELTTWLFYVEAAPGISQIDIARVASDETVPKWTQPRRFQQAEQIRHIAGLIEGTANLIRV